MSYDDHELIQTELTDGVLVATISAPPMNVMTRELFIELSKLSLEIEMDDATRVLVLRSADPDFFIAHFDVEAILVMPTDEPAERNSAENAFHAMCERFRTGSTVTIAEIDGRVGGGGAELSASFDMRFGSEEKFALCQMEVPIGILPGGTGTQRIPRLVGSGRAMEIILGGIDLDGATAEQWGWLNRALPASDLGIYVDALARRIAGFPPSAVEMAKQSVLNAGSMPLGDGLAEESFLFQSTLRDPAAQSAMQSFLDSGGQTRPGELAMQSLIDSL